MGQGGGVLEGRTVREVVRGRPSVSVHHLEEPVDVRRADEHVGVDAVPGHRPRRPGRGVVRRKHRQEAVIDSGPLDVQEVDAVGLGKHLDRRVREADAHRDGRG
jgi:uncharacterized protein with von Willebrand factor type A (vWA) domain